MEGGTVTSSFLNNVRLQLNEKESEIEQNDFIDFESKMGVTNRKERLKALRDDVRRFEVKLQQFYSKIEEGFEVTMWQLNIINDDSEIKEIRFTQKATLVHMKMINKENSLINAVITFTIIRGYFRKVIGRHRDESGILSLPLHEIIEIKAGCQGIDHMKLPNSRKTKGSDSKHISHFLTVKAEPTPTLSSRIYYFKLKSKTARNNLLMGLRGFLADFQINEVINNSSSGILKDSLVNFSKCIPGENLWEDSLKINHQINSNDDVMIPLSEVHKTLDKERKSYDRVLLMLLQGTCDLSENEDSISVLQGKLCSFNTEAEVNNGLVMRLNEKIESLVSENEVLRYENKNLNNRLVTIGKDLL